jgi:hypothetical protein
MREHSLGIDYRPTAEKSPLLEMRERVLLLLYEQDSDVGRTVEVSGWHNDLRQDLFMFSPRFVHSADLTLLSVIRWEEAEPYGEPRGQHDPGLTFPPGTIGVANLAKRTRQGFRLALRALLRQGYIYAFVSGLRAVKYLGGKRIPLPQLWSSENRDKLSDIVALSLTVQGFKAAGELAGKNRTMHAWQVHRFAALDQVFAAWLIGRDHQ